MNILISACLMGFNCRYDGKSNKYAKIDELLKTHNLIPFCPEIYGGLPTPRLPSEIVNNRIVSKNGVDVTDSFKKGAEQALYLSKLYNVKYAILKANSPSCGFGKIYDGTFSKNLICGNGITAALLSKNGITIYNENNSKL